MFLDDRLFYFFAECIDCFGSRHFALGIKRAFDAIARNLVGNFQQFLINLKQWHFTLWFGDLRGELFLRPDHFTGVPVCELERFHKIILGNFIGRAFDHDDVVFCADINEIEVTLLALSVRRVSDELSIHATDPDCANRPGEWDIGNAKRR